MPNSPPGRARLSERLIGRYFSAPNGCLHVGGVPLGRIADYAGTPTYIYDAELMRVRFRELARAVRGFAEVYYSIKANPNPAIARLFVSEGAGLEVASVAEYNLACLAGCERDRILFAGPGKQDAELEHVVRQGIGEIHVESVDEISRLDRIAARLNRQQRVALRINPVGKVSGGAMLMGGRPTQFGIDEERCLEAATRVEECDALSMCGVHLFTGTQILDSESLFRQWDHGIEIARRVAAHVGRPLATIDLGGGLGIPYYASDGELSIDRIHEHAMLLRKTLECDPLLASTRVLLEPGRYLTGPAGVFLVRVIEVKESRGEHFVIVDGGMHHHLAASGNLGQIIKRDYPVVAADKLEQQPQRRASIVGPLCTPLDTLARDTWFPPLEAGDLVAVLQSGAYGLTASPTGFLSHPAPAEVLVDNGKLQVIRPRQLTHAVASLGSNEGL